MSVKSMITVIVLAAPLSLFALPASTASVKMPIIPSIQGGGYGMPPAPKAAAMNSNAIYQYWVTVQNPADSAHVVRYAIVPNTLASTAPWSGQLAQGGTMYPGPTASQPTATEYFIFAYDAVTGLPALSKEPVTACYDTSIPNCDYYYTQSSSYPNTMVLQLQNSTATH